ncbi:MAG: LysR family transcriptional regulator [Pseudomonadota bacterium]
MDNRWDDLRIFLCVAREGGLTAAARVLRIDPATVSRHIARLEGDMDRALFVKSPQGYDLTASGSALLPRVEAMEAELRAGLAGLREPGDGLSGAIRIGAPDGCANFLLPGVCHRLSARYPDLDIQILALPRSVNLSRREADLAITVSPPTAGRLLVQKIADYHLHLAASAAYLADHPPISTADDLTSHRFVGYIPDMIFDRELDYLSALGVERVPLASSSAAVQVQMLATGSGVGVVHDFAMPAAPNLRFVLPETIAFSRVFYLVRHADDRASHRLGQFAQALVAEMRHALVPVPRA